MNNKINQTDFKNLIDMVKVAAAKDMPKDIEDLAYENQEGFCLLCAEYSLESMFKCYCTLSELNSKFDDFEKVYLLAKQMLNKSPAN